MDRGIGCKGVESMDGTRKGDDSQLLQLVPYWNIIGSPTAFIDSYRLIGASQIEINSQVSMEQREC